jgi:translation initiation factor 3 subunit D
VQPDWQVIEQVDFNQLARLKCVVGEPSDVQAAGSLQPLNRAVDRATSQTPVALAASERAFLNVTTTDDPVIQQLATSGDDDVFATDAILALLMTAPRAVDSFDIVFQKIGGKIFLDQRRAAATNLLSVNETATEPPKSEVK